MLSEFKSDIQALVSRREHIETKMADFDTSHNLLIDSHSALEEEVQRLANKVLDLGGQILEEQYQALWNTKNSHSGTAQPLPHRFDGHYFAESLFSRPHCRQNPQNTKAVPLALPGS